MGRIIRNTISYGFVTLILAALGFCIYLFLDDLDGPEVTMTPDTGRISPTQEITLKLADAKSGVRSVVVTIHRNNQSLVILDKVFSEPAPVQTTSFNLKNAGLRDGAFELEITARDNSLMSFGKGNGTTRKWNMQLDTQPPKVRIKTTVPALRRGSVTAIAYSVSEDASMTGVQLGEQFGRDVDGNHVLGHGQALVDAWMECAQRAGPRSGALPAPWHGTHVDFIRKALFLPTA